MAGTKLRVSGIGCGLVDSLYRLSFSEASFRPFLSKQKGDGGLNPGRLVFREEFEAYCGADFETALRQMVSDRLPLKVNIGGPSLVSMIHASQLTEPGKCDYFIYGIRGNDRDGNLIESLLGGTPLNTDNYLVTKHDTPRTVVLSDPGYDQGNGERMFIHSMGAARDLSPELLQDAFFESDIVVFGGTALVPGIHDHLTELLRRSKESGCITVVNTVYDFRNEKANPHLKWPLGKSDESYRFTDLLITDLEEALRLSGAMDLDGAMQFFREQGTGAAVVTRGAASIRVFSRGTRFLEQADAELPVSNAVSAELKMGHEGDTTGCGDNFAGGILASLVNQLFESDRYPDLLEACALGVVSGGTACFYVGGMFEEKEPGEKRKMIEPYYRLYLTQLENLGIGIPSGRKKLSDR
jgi:sugar/nucleoside kinase (ribokinase family)